MNRPARILAAAVLAASALAACSSGGDDSAGPSSSSSATPSAASTQSAPAPATEPNLTLACGRFYNGGDSSLKVRIATVAPAMDAQDAGTPLTDDQLAELGEIDASILLAVKVSPAPLADAYTAIHERIAGAVAAADSGEKNTATLDLPKQVAVIDTECAPEGFGS
ncbi:hypothetical protein [Cellulomonas edaphi]|uniref:Lipoprotein n=1 Tax=Cellulomonas edaphi TaxID=3053468 RepID=A0ABT7S3K0_9CELL|nr:hypothetical protein [Cellulomons edaphi]MDM7830195.1 hypothetical protein [Cellulomons edaphi]